MAERGPGDRGDLRAGRSPAAVAGRLRLLAATALSGPAAFASAEAAAAPWTGVMSQIPARVDPHGAVGLAVFMGLVFFATATAIIHIGQRRRWSEREAALLGEIGELRARCDRADVLLGSEPQIVVAWGGPGGEPDMEGDLALVSEGQAHRRVLAFGTWLPAAQAQAVETAVERLKTHGEGFRMVLRTPGGRIMEAEGRPVMGRAVLRVRDVSGDRLEVIHLQDQHSRLADEADAMRAMLDALPQPLWLRDAEGRLSWANLAYARAVEAPTGAEAVSQGVELLDRAVRDEAARARLRDGRYQGRVPVVVAGERRMFDVLDLTTAKGSIGIATDVSEIESLRAELNALSKSHADTLDQLPTAVAIFDGRRRLRFCNVAYRRLWEIEESFLDASPTDGEILDRLRHMRRLPEQADYRSWKIQMLEAYHALEPRETPWYLPDGRTLRVVTNPNPGGGVTYLFEDVTERFHLETQFNSVLRVQSETLAALKEGVAVFGADGRLKLLNPAFSAMWGLAPETTAERAHIEAIVARGRELCLDDAGWQEIRGAVAGLTETRQGVAVRMQRRDGIVLDCAAAPLPDGGTLLTFVDVTANTNVERALTERNEALERAGQLRESFVHHVSYELRSPLTNVIGFTQMLADGTVGPLNERQKDYANHILRSSAALMAIIDDILDLATIDTGEIELSLGPVDIRETIRAAVEGVQDRIAESRIRLVVDVPAGIGAMTADGKRVRQVLFNLLSNAIGFSRPGQTVTVFAERRHGAVVLGVRDEGRGIPAELLDRVFERFTSDTKGSAHRGVGLGLSIVRSFVELHGGTVDIASVAGQGTTVTCTFPADDAQDMVAAE
ncbi:PAS-domain containing protein [Alsobacter sp. SYSU M60028]|uniref:histidine kinase n=1 Tax=Alsobacter ponti TaxID=2962936 RepID=A0ABT1LDM3_9HYPH|nr:PAS domain-containing sensor histidine kinase [Alsobacter ponti]MCP8938825.1 PAS-domain containing protein [Alsobacter ponti]